MAFVAGRVGVTTLGGRLTLDQARVDLVVNEWHVGRESLPGLLYHVIARGNQRQLTPRTWRVCADMFRSQSLTPRSTSDPKIYV